MSIHRVHLTTPIRRSFRMEQVAGMFDLPMDELAERMGHTLTAELPDLGDDWTIGAIVGPSGSGKTTLARAAFGDAIYQPREWPADEAIIDCLERVEGRASLTSDLCSLTSSGTPLPFKQVLRTLTAVGLSSPPSWLKPYRVLSTGERFRADVARAIVSAERSLLVLDEFTSTLDRTVACTASYALGRFLRRHKGPGATDQEPGAEHTLLVPDSWPLAPPRFVALSCHTDFLPWLAPDWVLDLGAAPDVSGFKFQVSSCGENSTWNLKPETWNLLLRIERVPQKLWSRFAPHHYLSGGLSRAATCYAAFADAKVSGSKFQVSGCEDNSTWNLKPETWNSAQPVAFCAVVAALGWKRTKRITRLVVLPEYQGLGIGPRLAEQVAEIEAAQGNRVTITASHPAILGWCSTSPRWRYLGLKKTGSTPQQFAGRTIRSSAGRAVAAYEFQVSGSRFQVDSANQTEP